MSRGELHLTDKDLLYFRPSRFPFRWPTDYIRRYGFTADNNIFVFEVGRRCQTGEAVYAFRINQGPRFFQLLHQNIENRSKNCTPDRLTSAQQTNPAFNYSHNPNSSTRKVPFVSCGESTTLESNRHIKDASTSTDNPTIDTDHLVGSLDHQDNADPRPLSKVSYVLIDHQTTKALNQTAQAHAASRVKRP